MSSEYEPETYTITRLDEWSDDKWMEIIDAVEDTIASMAEEWDEEEEE